jgi:4-amino-4-deoxy-L-arabinose transferase-like glycosyltransferase
MLPPALAPRVDVSRKSENPLKNPAELPRTASPRLARLYRTLGAAALALLGLAGLFVLMASEGRVPRGALIGLFTTLTATLGLVHLLGGFELPEGALVRSPSESSLGRQPNEPAWAAPRVTVPLALLVLTVGVAGFGYDGLPITILLSLAALLPSAFSRPGLLLFVVVSAIYLPLLGVYGLWDPWETHYGEVAREILSRNDWISLWWAQDGWFWSKPILIFWMEALSMSALGVNPLPDAHPAHPEWALRLPIFLMSAVAVWAVYSLVRRHFSPRAGLLAGLVLATSPHFFLLAHQSITDMPLVACLTVSLCFLMLAFAEDPSRVGDAYRVGPFHLSARTAVLSALFILVLPQAMYLVTRNVTMVEPGLFAWHLDDFLHGSAGNAGIDGNAALHTAHPAVTWPLWFILGLPERGHAAFFDLDLAQPAFQALLWLAALAPLLYAARKERTAQGLLMYGFYIACGLGLMAKGLPALALPGVIALFYLAGSRRWDVLFRGELRVGTGMLVVTAVGMPWYLAMYVRHGRPFLDRLLIHDHIDRLASADVHGDHGSLQYFLAQLGYAIFPWVALAPAAVASFWWYRRRRPKAAELDPQVEAREQTLVFLALWAVSAFVLFSAMMTKFHHYVFPVVPPVAILCGILLHRLWGESAADSSRVTRAAGTSAALASGPVAALAVGGMMGRIRGVIPAWVPEAEKSDWVMRNAWHPAASIGLLGLALLLFGVGFWLLRRTQGPERFGEPRRLGLSVALLAGAAVLAFVGRDLSWVTPTRPQGYERLIDLFVYNYTRLWPAQFDYRPILSGFAVVAAVLSVLAAGRRLRPVLMRAFLGLALTFAAWGVNVYMIDLADHWSIRPLVERYYAARKGPEEAIVAWQMNWKGENFYTGNRVRVFTQLDNRAVRTWIESHDGEKAFFVLERTRLTSFRGLMAEREVEELTTERDCNKFVLVSAEL